MNATNRIGIDFFIEIRKNTLHYHKNKRRMNNEINKKDFIRYDYIYYYNRVFNVKELKTINKEKFP